MSSLLGRSPLVRRSAMALVTLVTCTAVTGVQLALGPVTGNGIASAPGQSSLDPSPGAEDSSASEPTVELPSAPELPLPPGATQFFIAPTDLDLTKFTFVYATFTGDLGDVARDMEKRLRKAGWRVRPGPRSTEDSFALVVRTPDRSASGQLDLLPLPPTPSGHTVQIVGSLELG